MTGIKYLLDTNFILGILKSEMQVIEALVSRKILAQECSYSTITRMELLGFHRITREEEMLIKYKLQHFSCLHLTEEIENKVISLRKMYKIKLPDAIIAATALYLGVELLSLDHQLLTIVQTENKIEGTH